MLPLLQTVDTVVSRERRSYIACGFQQAKLGITTMYDVFVINENVHGQQ